jgi:hypothetical protein
MYVKNAIALLMYIVNRGGLDGVVGRGVCGKGLDKG